MISINKNQSFINDNILVIAAHPDDEVLGCGGTIINHVKNNDKVNIIILSKGVTSRNISDKLQGHQTPCGHVASQVGNPSLRLF